MSAPGRRSGRGGVGGHEPRAVIESRAQQAWDLDAAGYSQREIAGKLQVSQAAVSKILRRVADRLLADRHADAERARMRLLARNDYLYREAMRGFERTQQPQTRRRQRQTTRADGAPGPAVIEAEVKERDGDPRFLDQAGRAVERGLALHGLDRPARRAQPPAPAAPAAGRDGLAGHLAEVVAGGSVGDTDGAPER